MPFVKCVFRTDKWNRPAAILFQKFQKARRGRVRKDADLFPCCNTFCVHGKSSSLRFIELASDTGNKFERPRRERDGRHSKAELRDDTHYAHSQGRSDWLCSAKDIGPQIPDPERANVPRVRV